MINALHLIWIIPVSVGFGIALDALLVANESDKKVQEGETP